LNADPSNVEEKGDIRLGAGRAWPASCYKTKTNACGGQEIIHHVCVSNGIICKKEKFFTVNYPYNDYKLQHLRQFVNILNFLGIYDKI